MRAYDVALFIHLLGVITLFVAMGLVQRGGAGVRTAATVEHLRLWLGLVRTTQRMFPAAIVLLLASGLFMTADAWTFTTPWVVVALVGLAAVAALGGVVVGRGFAAIGEAAARAGEGALPADLAGLIARRGLWFSASALNGAAIGILWLMATKPGWTVSVAAVCALAVLGGIVGFAIARPNRPSANPEGMSADAANPR